MGADLLYTRRDCRTVKVDTHAITITDPVKTGALQTWGDPRENPNGKYIKDWLSDRRSILFGGAMVTIIAGRESGCIANKADGGFLFDRTCQQDPDIDGAPRRDLLVRESQPNQ